MMRTMTLSEISKVTQGVLFGADTAFEAVSTDTRTLSPGELFVALEGENFDGNSLVAEAEACGAVAAVVSRKGNETIPRVLVNDTGVALGEIAALNRMQSSAVVIAVTGSQGKTTVKEMLASILGSREETLVTHANLNNTIGVPLTLLELSPQHKFAVIEMGANCAGEIAFSVTHTRPDIAHITNVAATHIEGFGSLDGVCQAKSEIWQGLSESGTAVINLDDAFSARWLHENSARRVVTISTNGAAEADYALQTCEINPAGFTKADLRTPSGLVQIDLPLPGMHNLANALAATALAMEAGARTDDVVAGLGLMKPVPGRMNFLTGLNQSLVVDDTYNASPSSFRAAIDVLSDLPGKTVLVMGDMGELGNEAELAHKNAGEYARSKGVNALLAVGDMSALAADQFGEHGRSYSNQEELVAALQPLLAADVSVLVKGSRSARMEKVLEQLVPGGR